MDKTKKNKRNVETMKKNGHRNRTSGIKTKSQNEKKIDDRQKREAERELNIFTGPRIKWHMLLARN